MTEPESPELPLSPEGQGFQKVATVADLPANRGFRVKVGGKYIALFKVGETISAINAICPHAGAFLDMGFMDGECVICPLHGWDFNVRTGVSPTYGISAISYETRVVGEDVFVKI